MVRKDVRVDAARQFIQGAKKHLTRGVTLHIDGEEWDAKAVEKVLGSRIDATAKVAQAFAEWREALREERKTYKATHQASLNLIDSVRIVFRSRRTVLSDFGVAPKKVRRALTVLEQTAAGEKRAATRAARHTKGPRQRAKIKGVPDTKG